MRNIISKLLIVVLCVIVFHSFIRDVNPKFTPQAYSQPDPFFLYSTYIGGDDAECIQDICVDLEGCAYITGWTRSDFIADLHKEYHVPGFDQTLDGDTDAFVIKISANGERILYASYIGGTSNEVGFCVEVNDNNEAFIAGWTQSSETEGFPIGSSIPGFDTTHNHFLDSFLIKVSSDGEEILYSTYIGGYYRDVVFAMDIDESQRVVVAGWTESSQEDGFPIGDGIPGYSTVFHGERDGFLLQFSSDGSDILYATYLGGAKDEVVKAIASGDDGKVYITGWTRSSYEEGFLQTPTQDNAALPGFQKKHEKGSDGFALCLSIPQNKIAYNTYIGGLQEEEIYSIAVDDVGCAYIVGKTCSSSENGFPIDKQHNGFDKQMDGDNDGFVIKLTPTGTDIAYSTYIGGQYFTDVVTDICITKNGTALITGWTNSTFEHGFPIRQIGNYIIPGNDTEEKGHFDVFLMELTSDGNEVLYSTYIGGTGPEWSYCIAQDADGNIFLAGNTESTPDKEFPIGNPTPGHQCAFQGLQDGFVLKVSSIPEERILVDVTLELGYPFAFVHPSNAIEPIQIEMDCYPVFENSVYLVPMRFLGDAFGATVRWDAKNAVATIEYFHHFVTFWPNREGTELPNLVVQNRSSKESTPYYAVQSCIQNGRILFDLHYVEEIFKAVYSTESSDENISIRARYQRVSPSL